jgi:drug/metabolite transporter superfamily protein YnfA
LSTEPAPVQPAYPVDTPASIRRQAVWALIAALVLLYYGYREYAPDERTLSRVFAATLRYGGIAMVVAAAALATGTKWGLLVDGVVSLLVGAGLAYTGVSLVMAGVNLESVLILIFAYLFLSSGWRSFRGFLGADVPPGPAATPPAEPPPAG